MYIIYYVHSYKSYVNKEISSTGSQLLQLKMALPSGLVLSMGKNVDMIFFGNSSRDKFTVLFGNVWI